MILHILDHEVYFLSVIKLRYINSEIFVLASLRNYQKSVSVDFVHLSIDRFSVKLLVSSIN
ncbi:hypothetical protein NIES806_30300 [Dolichospermum compactum NIES-806]|uniref:Uncharacterized protein n=1 Tax=Dolichospermum compactum NIES-806 TaxID=1973481 RepID=A0A1Z4V5U3_9CYAN|nr:hypothetical protein NIES806_30300 [Dolichospermum compactum NIES-806]